MEENKYYRVYRIFTKTHKESRWFVYADYGQDKEGALEKIKVLLAEPHGPYGVMLQTVDITEEICNEREYY
jgi:hypothetical protein